MRSFSLLAALAATASAYEVLTPTLNSTVTKGTEVNVKWTSVDTDADTFSIYLANFQTAHWPPTVLSLAQHVPRDSGSLKVRIPCDLSSDYGWQLNFINGTNTYVIYAQSPLFSLTGDCVEPTPTPSPKPTYSHRAYGNNVTATVTAVETIVQTVVIETPVVWFVQPTNVVAAAAVCPPGPAKTVTVWAHGDKSEVCGASDKWGSSGGSYPTKTPSAGGYGGNKGGESGPYPTTTPGGYGKGTPSSKAPTPTASNGWGKSSNLPLFTGAASANKVGGGVVMAVAGAVAMML